MKETLNNKKSVGVTMQVSNKKAIEEGEKDGDEEEAEHHHHHDGREEGGGGASQSDELVQLFSEEDEVPNKKCIFFSFILLFFLFRFWTVINSQVRMFFESLDEELDKVNQFYRTKEAEFVERGELLNKQLQTLLDLKQILADRRRKNFQSRSNSGRLLRSLSSSVRNSDFSGEGFFSHYIRVWGCNGNPPQI